MIEFIFIIVGLYFLIRYVLKMKKEYEIEASKNITMDKKVAQNGS